MDQHQDDRAARQMWLELPGALLFLGGFGVISAGQSVAGAITVVAGALIFFGARFFR